MNATKTLEWLMDDCPLYRSSEKGEAQLNIYELAGNLAYHAMMLEVHLTPKAGLVDCVSSGAHCDMDIDTFIASSNTLRPYMKLFVKAGCNMHEKPAKELLPGLRKVGIQAENAMFRATNNVNTHKGMIFTLGLICGAVGWLHKKGISYDAARVRAVIKECCADLVSKELKDAIGTPKTAGERAYHQHGLTGIRGEAAKGYPTIFKYSLPLYEGCIRSGQSEEQAMSKSLLSLMAHNDDSNLVNRGGIEGLNYVQLQAQGLLQYGDLAPEYLEQKVTLFDQQLIERNLSPGGSADLLAATWLLAQLNVCSQILVNKR
ncbi:triphosphoribosyl-dephospho-CoA synthase CitG [Vibrio lamellibrachiae]|uniref:triphosphoribosyl-dephospho-CoA synthase CitG n=1 Tax=Vibrio lamellibrachiae TaxID=2910253 RepID=UPI003D0D42B4